MKESSWTSCKTLVLGWDELEWPFLLGIASDWKNEFFRDFSPQNPNYLAKK
jgi:hypothetical protein